MFPNTAPGFTFIYVCNKILSSASHSLFYLQKSFLQTVADLFIYKDPFYKQSRIYLCTKILSTGSNGFVCVQRSSLQTFTSSSSVFFPFLFLRTRHGGVGQRSGTGLETPLLGWALPLRILNHVSLGVDVPVFFHPGDVTSFSYFFS